MGNKYSDVRPTTPGPAAYNIPTKLVLKSSGSGACIGNDKKLSDKCFSTGLKDGPGPGAYSIDTHRQK